MRVRLCLSLLVVHACSAASIAQHAWRPHDPSWRDRTPSRPNAPGKRAAAHAPGAAASNSWMQQFWYEQMMLSEMISRPRANHRPVQPARANSAQAGMTQSRPERKPGMDVASCETQSRLPIPAVGPATEGERPCERQEGCTRVGTAQGENHERELAALKNRGRSAVASARLPLAADRGTISLLRTVRTRLSGLMRIIRASCQGDPPRRRSLTDLGWNPQPSAGRSRIGQSAPGRVRPDTARLPFNWV